MILDSQSKAMQRKSNARSAPHPQSSRMTLAAASPSLALADELRDIRPPVEISSFWPWVWWTIAALVAGALAFWAWRAWQRRRDRVPVEPVIPAHVRARRKLDEALALIGQPREFCILVSDTIRLYLEERFTFRAPERTTEEFLHELQGTELLTRDQKESLGEFLQRCDLVKFARYEPREPELRDLHASALRLVEETEPRSDHNDTPQETGPAISDTSSATVNEPHIVHGKRNTENETPPSHVSRITRHPS
jgi:hypothetical protein